MTTIELMNSIATASNLGRMDISAGTLWSFLWIGSNPGRSQSELISAMSRYIGGTKQTASRHCSVLSVGMQGRDGLQWVRLIEDSRDRRSKLMYLTELGQEVFKKVTSGELSHA